MRWSCPSASSYYQKRRVSFRSAAVAPLPSPPPTRPPHLPYAPFAPRSPPRRKPISIDPTKKETARKVKQHLHDDKNKSSTGGKAQAAETLSTSSPSTMLNASSPEGMRRDWRRKVRQQRAGHRATGEHGARGDRDETVSETNLQLRGTISKQVVPELRILYALLIEGHDKLLRMV